MLFHCYQLLCQYLIFLLDLSLMGQTSPDMEMSARELRQNVEMAFNRLDTNGDGVLTREEFVLSCLKVRPSLLPFTSRERFGDPFGDFFILLSLWPLKSLLWPRNGRKSLHKIYFILCLIWIIINPSHSKYLYIVLIIFSKVLGWWSGLIWFT